MGSTHQEFIVDMFTTFRGILWKYKPSHTEMVRGGGHKRVCIFKGVSFFETLSYCTLHAEFFCKSGQEFAFCRRTASQVGRGGRKKPWQTVRSDIKNVQVHARRRWNSSCTSSSVFLSRGRRKPLKKKTAWCWTMDFSIVKYLLATACCYSHVLYAASSWALTATQIRQPLIRSSHQAILARDDFTCLHYGQLPRWSTAWDCYVA